jgi:hypothetical protein
MHSLIVNIRRDRLGILSLFICLWIPIGLLLVPDIMLVVVWSEHFEPTTPHSGTQVITYLSRSPDTRGLYTLDGIKDQATRKIRVIGKAFPVTTTLSNPTQWTNHRAQ